MNYNIIGLKRRVDISRKNDLPQCLVIGLKSPRKKFIEMAKNHKKITYP